MGGIQKQQQYFVNSKINDGEGGEALFFIVTDHLKCETLQAVVSLMSGGGVGVGDRLDTLDTDLVNYTL